MCKGEKRDDFIGQTFLTPKGGILTVVGTNNLKGDSKRYLCTCSICSKDTELFPKPFEIRKGHLKRGSTKCGCSKVTFWSKDQYYVLIMRECVTRECIFHGFSVEWEGNRTKLHLECKKDKYVWKNARIATFLQGRGCPKCAQKSLGVNNKLSDTECIRHFMETDKFLEDTTFIRVGCKDEWSYICPTCSKDEFVMEGLCSGVFYSKGAKLKEGHLACRCSKAYHWSQGQVEYRITNYIKTLGGKSIGWHKDGTYINNKSKFDWVCSEGHFCSMTVTSMLHRFSGCNTCRKLKGNHNGYYEERKDEKDYLYLMDFLVSTKVGRSFKVAERQTELKRISGIKDKPEILQTYTATHQVIYDTEQAVHAELRERGFQHYCDWTTECFTKDCWYILQEILEDYVGSGTIHKVP